MIVSGRDQPYVFQSCLKAMTSAILNLFLGRVARVPTLVRAPNRGGLIPAGTVLSESRWYSPSESRRYSSDGPKLGVSLCLFAVGMSTVHRGSAQRFKDSSFSLL